jgi:branched-chain amino acid transport system substrate-binding protein
MKRWLRPAVALTLFSCLCLWMMAGPSAAAPDKIKVGVMFSMTGAGSSIGKMQLDGVKLAIKEINEAGGIPVEGKKLTIETVIRDDESKPDVAVRRFRELVQNDKVDLFVGCTFAHISKALNEQAAQIKNILFMPVNGIPESIFFKNEKAPYTLNPLGSNEGVGRISADYVSKRFKPKHVVLFHPDYAYGRGAAEGAHKVFKRFPETKVSEVWSPLGTPDFTSYINKVEELKPDVVMLGHWGNDGIGVLKQIYELKLAKKTKVFYNWIINAFAVGVPAEAMEGITCQMWWYHDMTGFKDPRVVNVAKKVSENWMREYKEAPDPYAMTAYEGVQEAARGIRLAKSLEPAKVYKAIMDNPDWTSAKGPSKWRVDGRSHYKYTSFIVEGKGPKERKDPKWDFAKVVDSYEGDEYELPVKEEGW